MAELLGMIHLPNLRTISGPKGLNEITAYAVSEAGKLADAGFDGLIVENFGDTPFVKSHVSTTVLSKLVIVCHALVEQDFSMKVGLNILRNASVQAMEVATVLGLDFIRSNIWEGAYITDQGLIEGAAYEVMETKHNLRSRVKVYADVMVKHATPLADFTITEAAEQALHRGGADRIILSGRFTGDPVSLESIERLNTIDIKPVIGSGATLTSIENYVGKVSAIIVGTAIKSGAVTSPIDLKKASEFANTWKTMG